VGGFPDRLSPLHVACASNAGYLPHVATLMESLAASNAPESLRLYLLHDASVGPALQERLLAAARRLGLELRLICPDEEHIRRLPPTNAYYPSLIWYRILLPELLPELDRILYLDADTLVLQDLSPLWRTELGENLLGAVAQHRLMEGGECLDRPDLSTDAGYFNSGVLLMNLQAMRDKLFSAQMLKVGRELAGAVNFPDQDAYNIACAGQWQRLHPRWNAFASLFLSGGVEDYIAGDLVYAEAIAAPGILHFEGSAFAKPWYYRCVHPHRALYRAYRSRTDWPLQQLDGDSLKSRVLFRLPLGLQLGISRSWRWLRGVRGLDPRDGPTKGRAG